MTDTPRNALIVGAGLAGLTAAATMSRAGIMCDVIDLHESPAGAAITLLNRAIGVLDELGALEACCERGTPTSPRELFAHFDAAGVPVPTPPMPEAPASDLPQGLLIFRPDLARILRSAAEDAGARVQIGLTIDALNQREDGVGVTFSDGSSGRYDMVIGADGVRSKTRSLVLDPGEAVNPTYSGVTMFRWMTDGVPDVAPTGHYQAENLVVVRRMHDGRIYVATGESYPTAPILTQATARQAAERILNQFSAPLVREIARRFDSVEKIIVNDYDWLLMPRPWYRGRVLLIGDAAHATTAHLASGGGMAMEDGAVLGQELGKSSSVDEGYRRFMDRRFERVRLVVETSVQLDRMLQGHESPAAQNAIRQRAMQELARPY